MTLFVLERVSPGLRGRLSRWMLEVRAGVFVGTLTARVREKLWQAICAFRGRGSCVMIHNAQTEQGFVMVSDGEPTRTIEDFDGLYLVRIHNDR